MSKDPETLLNESFSLLLISMDELNNSSLRIVVLAAGLSEAENDPVFPERQSRKLEIQADSRYFEITFDHYVYYLVVNESHWTSDMEAEGRGNKLIRYSKSNLLNISDTISHPYDVMGDRPLRHMEVATENHLIHVLTYSEPDITIHENAPTAETIKNAAIRYHS